MVDKYCSYNVIHTLKRLGGSNSTIARAKRVTIYNKRGKVSGVIGNTAIHLQDSKNGGGKQPSWKDIFVDIGVMSFKEAIELVHVEVWFLFISEMEYLIFDLLTCLLLYTFVI